MSDSWVCTHMCCRNVPTIPRGFTRCDECEGEGEVVFGAPGAGTYDATFGINLAGEEGPCPSCSGSGLMPTEKLREEAEEAAIGVGLEDVITARAARLAARRVLAKVAEHLGGGE